MRDLQRKGQRRKLNKILNAIKLSDSLCFHSVFSVTCDRLLQCCSIHVSYANVFHATCTVTTSFMGFQFAISLGWEKADVAIRKFRNFFAIAVTFIAPLGSSQSWAHTFKQILYLTQKDEWLTAFSFTLCQLNNSSHGIKFQNYEQF